MKTPSICAALVLTTSAWGADPVFDTHVHLRDGETSLKQHEAEVRKSGIDMSGFGAMWFGGPHQAQAGNPASIRANNDALIALARQHSKVVPIATVHP